MASSADFCIVLGSAVVLLLLAAVGIFVVVIFAAALSSSPASSASVCAINVIFGVFLIGFYGLALVNG